MKNYIQYIKFLPSLILFFLFTSAFGQSNHKFIKEQKHFLSFLRDSVFKGNDDLLVRKLMCNKNKFTGTVLYGKDSHKGLLTDEEINIAIKQMHDDTTCYELSPNTVKHVKLVNMNDSADYELSKPIFIRDYQFCIFSFNSLKPDTQTTILFKKEKRRWFFVKVIGNILNY